MVIDPTKSLSRATVLQAADQRERLKTANLGWGHRLRRWLYPDGMWFRYLLDRVQCSSSRPRGSAERRYSPAGRVADQPVNYLWYRGKWTPTRDVGRIR